MPPDQRHPQIQHAGQIHCAVHEKPFPCPDCRANQSNLPEGVERYKPEMWHKSFVEGYRARCVPNPDGDYVRVSDLPAIEEQARQEEREKVREALAKATARASIHTREAGQVLPIESIEIALDSLNPDTPEGGSDGS